MGVMILGGALGVWAAALGVTPAATRLAVAVLDLGEELAHLKGADAVVPVPGKQPKHVFDHDAAHFERMD